MADGARQVGDGLFVLPGGDEVGGLALFLLAERMGGEAVARHLLQHVFGIVGPFQRHIAAGQQGTGHIGHLRLGGIEAQDVVAGAGTFNEVSLLKLALGHEQPCTVQKGVKLLPCQIEFLLGRTFLVALGHGLLLDAVHLDGLFAFGDGRLKVGLPHCLGRLVGAHVHGQQPCVVLLVALVLGLHSFIKGHLPIVEGVEAGCGGMIEACAGGVLLGGAPTQT